MLSDLFVMLFLIAMVLFIVYHFYIDYRNWSNTGNTFAEGMASGETPLITREGESKAWNPPFTDLSTRGGTKNKLGAGEGDCDSDSQCLDGLKCKQRTEFEKVLGHSGEGKKGWDYCYDPNFSVNVNNLTSQQVMNRQTQARAGISNPMQSTVPQECRQGCVAPNGPSGNCENIRVGGNLKKKCPYSCPRPTFKRGDTVNCAYDKHCNACEPKKMFDPAAPPNMPGARPGGYCPPGQNCDPRLGQPVGGVNTNTWVGSRIDVPGIHHAPGLPPVQQPNFWSGHFPSGPMPPAFAQKFQQQILAREIPPPPQGHPLEAPLRQALGGAIQLPPIVESPVQPSGAGPTQWIGRPATQGLPSQTQSQPATATPASNALFNEQVMTQVLANKNLIPADINLGIENQGNFITVGKNFMKDVSHIRNIALPNIDDDDYESLGRVIAKIKIHEKQSDDGPQSMVAKKQLANSVKNILSGTMISNSQVDWETPGQKPNITTTGMYGDNSNSMMGYGDKAKKHHREKPDGGLCLWKGCEKHIKGKPYDSVWSLY